MNGHCLTGYATLLRQKAAIWGYSELNKKKQSTILNPLTTQLQPLTK